MAPNLGSGNFMHIGGTHSAGELERKKHVEISKSWPVCCLRDISGSIVLLYKFSRLEMRPCVGIRRLN